MQIEVWKDIEGYKGLYQISNQGRVKSCNNKSNHTNEIILKPVNCRGYQTIVLCKNGVNTRQRVHRLVANAFIPNKEHKPLVNHIDGNKSNNNVSNLEWCTQKENMIHAFQKGLCKKGKEHRNSKAIIMYDLQTGDKIQEFFSINDASKKTGICISSISKACSKRYKHANGKGFKYAIK